MNSDKLHHNPSPTKSVVSKKDIWNETKKEEDAELDFASEHFPDKPWMWCGACKVGICEESH